jgi:hypothetical protein
MTIPSKHVFTVLRFTGLALAALWVAGAFLARDTALGEFLWTQAGMMLIYVGVGLNVTGLLGLYFLKFRQRLPPP